MASRKQTTKKTGKTSSRSRAKKKIDNKYLFTEIFTGIMFLIIYNVYNLGVIMLNLSGFRVLDTLSILSILRNTIYI